MKKILISKNPWETKAAILKKEVLQNVFFSSHADKNLERCFFKGIVTKILPGIQTAFVDIGQERAGFLHISEIDRDLAISRMEETLQIDTIEEKETRKQPLDISKILKEGESILVQVSKEPIYEKGAKLTTCFTLPGRFIVLMPNIPRIGISKKIENKDERNRLKEIVKSFLPQGMGAIIRTSSENRKIKELSKDISFLIGTWKYILNNYEKAKNTEKIYEDLPLYLQVIRDNLDDDIDEVIVDDKEIQNKIYKFVKGIAPEFSNKIKLWQKNLDIFEYFNINQQIENSLRKKVNLESGGSIIIETTEAMTVIDVNTGKFTGKASLEETILQINLEATKEIVRQIRLRNIGGLIVIDFIDMTSASSRQKLVRFFEQTLKEEDKFQSVVLKVSEFGLLQMTRKRSGKTLIQQLMESCDCCNGLGVIKSIKTQAYNVLNNFKNELAQKQESKITLIVHPKVFDYLTNVEFNSILSLEKIYKCRITLLAKESMKKEEYKIEFK